MSKMVTVEQRAVGSFKCRDGNEARIERSLFALDGKNWEGLRFCKNRKGRPNHVDLVISEHDFIGLFHDAVGNGVFHQETLDELRAILEKRHDHFLGVIGICKGDGTLTENIDEELYGDNPV